MTVTVPRADLYAINERYHALWPFPSTSPTAEDVREYATHLRKIAGEMWSGVVPEATRDEADALDALADRYEREAGR